MKTYQEEKETNPVWKGIKKGLWGALIILLLFGSWFSVPAGHKGILLTFGKPSESSFDNGFHLKIPLIQNVVVMSTQTQKYVADAQAASKDLQIVHTQIAVNYHLNSNSVIQIYTDLGLQFDDRVIQPTVQEVVKASTAEFTAEELITKRPQVKDKIDNLLKERLQSRNIIIEDISITNFDFSESFNVAIESKVTAEQLKLKADNDLLRILVEAKQKIASAGAEAESLRLQRLEITPDLIELRKIEVQRFAIEKWDGHLPQVTGGVIPFIDINNKVGGTS